MRIQESTWAMSNNNQVPKETRNQRPKDQTSNIVIVTIKGVNNLIEKQELVKGS